MATKKTTTPRPNYFFYPLVILITIVALILVVKGVSLTKKALYKTQTVSAKTVSQQIMAEGSVRSENEANLHFAAGGKVTYLPFKEGDTIYQGQTIASTDTYTIERQLKAALNNYRSMRNSFDQMQDNSADSVLKTQQITPYDFFAKAGLGGSDRDTAITNALNRILDQSQANLDNSVINVELANYAYTLASISAPFTGILVHQDLTSTGIIATPANSFVLIDPKSLVFRANISEDLLKYVSVGGSATIRLNSDTKSQITGSVVRIYPDKIALSNGEAVYQVDIASPDLSGPRSYKLTGVAFITNKSNLQVTLVPSWLIIGGHQLWVISNGHPMLKTITTGDTNGQNTEVVGGLLPEDQIIVSPKSLIFTNYFFQ